jgi:hypothetical protein
MSKKSKPISEYVLNGLKHKTIEAKNKNGERVWVKSEPADKTLQTIKAANILDNPQDVTWLIKCSHIEEIRPIFGKRNYSPAATAGSFCVPSGVFKALKEPKAEVILFPLDSINPDNPVNVCKFIGNLDTGSAFMGSVDAPTWIAYATTAGTITLL